MFDKMTVHCFYFSRRKVYLNNLISAIWWLCKDIQHLLIAHKLKSYILFEQMCDTSYAKIGFCMITCLWLHSIISLYLGQYIPVGGVSYYSDYYVMCIRVLTISHRYLYTKFGKFKKSVTKKRKLLVWFLLTVQCLSLTHMSGYS